MQEEEEKSVIRTVYVIIWVSLSGPVLILVSASLQWQGKVTTFASSEAMEHGRLNQCSVGQEAFFCRISESAAILFRTAKPRIQVNALLAQGKEVPASKEELQAQGEKPGIISCPQT